MTFEKKAELAILREIAGGKKTINFPEYVMFENPGSWYWEVHDLEQNKLFSHKLTGPVARKLIELQTMEVVLDVLEGH